MLYNIMNQRMDGDTAQSVSQQVYSPEMTESVHGERSGVTRHEEPRLGRTHTHTNGWLSIHRHTALW